MKKGSRKEHLLRKWKKREQKGIYSLKLSDNMFSLLRIQRW